MKNWQPNFRFSRSKSRFCHFTSYLVVWVLCSKMWFQTSMSCLCVSFLNFVLIAKLSNFGFGLSVISTPVAGTKIKNWQPNFRFYRSKSRFCHFRSYLSSGRYAQKFLNFAFCRALGTFSEGLADCKGFIFETGMLWHLNNHLQHQILNLNTKANIFVLDFQ